MISLVWSKGCTNLATKYATLATCFQEIIRIFFIANQIFVEGVQTFGLNIEKHHLQRFILLKLF